MRLLAMLTLQGKNPNWPSTSRKLQTQVFTLSGGRGCANKLQMKPLRKVNLSILDLLVLIPLGKHVRSCIVYTWDHKSSASFWAGMKV
jgi:hypothetical protein